MVRREIIVSVARLSRLWLNLVAREIRIKNYEIFRQVVWNRPSGLLTVSNHISTLDDPLIWGALLDDKQINELIKEGNMRWAVGARELTFTNALTSWFFGKGQVIPIVRGNGIYQPAMSKALEILQSGRWLHFFPEGRVVQYAGSVGRLKWGVGRLLAESKRDFTILPMYLKGFDWMKPNDQVPQLDHKLEIVIGEPFSSNAILTATEHISNEDERRILITKYIQDILNETKHK